MTEKIANFGRRAEAVHRRLLEDIEKGRYEVDTLLPSERKLADRFGFSRTSVRKAIEKLEAEGHVVKTPGRGVYVRSRPNKASRAAHVAVMYNFSGDKLTHVQDLLLERGYLLTTYSQRRTHWDHELERKFLKVIQREGHRGLLAYLSPKKPHNDDILAELDAAGTRVVHVEHYREDLPDQSYILPDYRRAAHMATVKLMMAGYAPVYLVHRSGYHAPYAEMIRQGFQHAIEEHQPEADVEALLVELPPREQIEELLPDRIRSLPAEAGFVCMTPDFAGSMADALVDAEREVPEEAGLMAIHLPASRDHGVADLMSFDREKMLEEALDAVCQNEWEPPRRLVIPHHVDHGTVR